MRAVKRRRVSGKTHRLFGKTWRVLDERHWVLDEYTGVHEYAYGRAHSGAAFGVTAGATVFVLRIADSQSVRR